MMKIGFVGLGAMGLPMAVNLVRAGHEVRGADLNERAVAAFAEAGGHPARDLADAVVGCNVLLLMVVNADQAEAVLFEAGAAETLPKGALVIASCTQAPSRARATAERLDRMGLKFLDAPVSGGAVGAEAGSLTIMASGSAEAFAIARPILDILGGNVYKLGNEPGLGSMMKTVNQLMCGAHIAVAAEATQLAAKAGIDPALAQEVLMSGAAASWMLGNRGPRMLQAEPPVTSAVDIFVKDLGLVLDAGKEARVGLPMAAAAMQMFLAASGQGLGRRDDSHVIRAYEVLNGVEITRKG
ncbi:MAG: NAD(P)-dependent oxidoreductase [Rhodobiaceae bacterium]|nr:NAD(P)-dependent oxidoreductase [Rhodobiaceae bacterium]MCC0050973.1 NAD(P)-dependent oxidoreductase [Rhodobiaceae bacterium]MCC0060333.1 NAD(P)-dependent oxidoreductase [Rhodobiaceae bacterium]